MSSHPVSITALALLLATTLAVAWLLTWLALVYARRALLLDIPNERSSHRAPTPRGGGVAMVLAWVAAVTTLWMWGLIPHPWLVAWIVGGLAVAAVGWRDDHRSVGPATRLLVHTAAASWAVLWMGGLPQIDLGLATVSLGPIGALLPVLGIVWLTNLYNFMDGIDGLAATQAVGTSAVAGAILWAAGADALAAACLVMAAASAGFLFWNWPPAKVFMGDVGSGWLGFSFGTLIIAGEQTGALPAAVWVVLLSVFIWDATFTLLARITRGERWYNAHRCHAYQRAVEGGMSHLGVTMAVLMLDIFWFWPAACLAWAEPALLPGVLAATMLSCAGLWRGIQRWEQRKKQQP